MDENRADDDLFLLFGLTAFCICTEENIHFDGESPDKNDVVSNLQQIEEAEQQNTLSVKSFVKDKAIEMYAKKGMENVKKTLKTSEPLVVGSIDKEKIKDSDMDIVFQLKNIKLYNLGSFHLKKFKSISEQNAAEFSVEIPSVKAFANYDINGKFKGKNVNGKGDADINLIGVSIDNGRVVIKETPDEVQIASIYLCYDFKQLTIEQTGLNIEGMKANEVTKFLNDSGKKYLKDNKKKICDRVATELKNRANAKMKGKNREQLMEMMKGM